MLVLTAGVIFGLYSLVYEVRKLIGLLSIYTIHITTPQHEIEAHLPEDTGKENVNYYR